MTSRGDSRSRRADRPGASTGALHASVDTDGPTIVIRLAGSLRCATAPALREAVDAALDGRPATIVLDLAGLRADDELGLWVLPAMAGHAARRGIDLVIAAPDRALRIRLRRLGGHHLNITETAPVTHGSSR